MASMRRACSGAFSLAVSSLALAFLCGAAPAIAQDTSPLQIAFQGSTASLTRLQIEARVGVVRDISLSNQGTALRVDLRGASRAEGQALVDALQKRGGDIKSARLVAVNATESYLWIDLRRPRELRDQTVVAAPRDRSRWEIVLGDPAAAPSTAIALTDLQLGLRDDLFEVRLAGSESLTAEVSILDKPSRVVIELPGASPAAVERFVANYRPAPVALLKRVSSAQVGGVARLVLELSDDVDLVDSAGSVLSGQGRIRMAFATDRAVARGAAPSLRAIDAAVVGRQVDFTLQGAESANVHSYALSDPPRLVVDVLGTSPAQAAAPAAAFKAPHPGVLGVRVESTRLGSARLVFDLSSPSSVLARAKGGSADGATVAVRTPVDPSDPSYIAAAASAPPPISASQRTPRVDANAPLVVIRPVMLQAPVRTGPGSATGLMALYARALDSDPRYRAAKKDFDIASEAVPQARAGLLPTATIDYQRSTIDQDVIRASNATFPTGSSNYGNNNLSLTITQPLIKLPAWVRLNQASRSIEQARFNLLAAEQDLMLRLASAYLNVSAATDGVALAEAERMATEKQLEQARVRLANGLGNVTQVYDTDARFSLAKAREVEARNRLDDARQGVREILGSDVPAPRGFREDFQASGPLPADVAPWVAAAADQNLSNQSRKLAVEIAALEIRRQQAGYAPTLNLVASSTRVDTGGSLFGAGQRYNNNEIGVRLSVPLFEGGMTSSLVRESVSRHEKSQDEYEQELRKSERQARAAFNGVVASLESQEALRRAVVAQQSALDSREEGLRSGLFTPVAVIDSYRLFYAAKRDYLQARYDYLVNRLKLKQAVGALSREDLEDMNALLEP